MLAVKAHRNAVSDFVFFLIENWENNDILRFSEKNGTYNAKEHLLMDRCSKCSADAFENG